MTGSIKRRWLWCAVALALAWAATRIDRWYCLRPVNGVEQDVARWRDEPFTSILRREHDVFAVNRWGMFRASLEDKQWQLGYDTFGVADRERGEWVGSIWGPVFTVTILPKE